ncbi:hypothetical protein Y032_0328g2636 [Ancylostoma ceylanicum]|uniref:SCP domain-containing protein n=1 Tax=Ancylostoma ceylanicum TaxID=53326 RepID=A0A016RZN9_9BILA|nr:hypothetical protein Y032_0328g2636 [Ancylostoma ceylanicum]
MARIWEFRIASTSFLEGHPLSMDLIRVPDSTIFTEQVIRLIVALLLCNAASCRAAFSCSNSGLSDEIREVFLSYHNDARLRVALGTEPNKVGTLNPAKNMYKLVI